MFACPGNQPHASDFRCLGPGSRSMFDASPAKANRSLITMCTLGKYSCPLQKLVDIDFLVALSMEVKMDACLHGFPMEEWGELLNKRKLRWKWRNLNSWENKECCSLWLDWIGLDWIGLDWIGVEWSGVEGTSVAAYHLLIYNTIVFFKETVGVCTPPALQRLLK